MGERTGCPPHADRRCAHHSLLADPYRSQAQDVYAASLNELRRDSRAHAESLGQVLQLERDLAAICLYAELARAGRLHVPLQALPADVRGNGNLDRQRAPQEIRSEEHTSELQS